MGERYADGATIGTHGSENGVILKDEEYDGACRITLEWCGGHCAVTCGIYGCMMHTAFCDNEDMDKLYDAMRHDLQEFLDTQMTEEDEVEFYDDFTHRY